MLRIGEFYPDLTPDFSYDDCPEFWQNNKININVLNMGNEDYMKNIQISSYVGITLAVIVEIVAFYYTWRGASYYDEDNDLMVYGGMRTVFKNKSLCGKIKFIFIKIIIGFGLSFADTITGKKLF